MSMILNMIPASRETIAGLLAEPDSVTDFIDNAQDACDLDKAWHGIHFLLCGDEWSGSMPEGTLLAGGRPIGDVDVGYGPARALSPEDVASFYAAIATISDSDFDARFDAKKLLDHSIYPEIWDRDLKGEPDGRPYLNEYFRILKEFIAKQAKDGKGVVIAMC
jgi:hypothetical protein